LRNANLPITACEPIPSELLGISFQNKLDQLSARAGQYRLPCQAGDCQSRRTCYTHSNSSIRHSASSGVISRVRTSTSFPRSQPCSKDAIQYHRHCRIRPWRRTNSIRITGSDQLGIEVSPRIRHPTWEHVWTPSYFTLGHDLSSSNLTVPSSHHDEARRIVRSLHRHSTFFHYPSPLWCFRKEHSSSARAVYARDTRYSLVSHQIQFREFERRSNFTA
jgi:hypothetical protein